MLKLCVETIGPYMLKLINKSLGTDMYPASWKLAPINPLSKTTQPIFLNDTRPAALIPELSKLTERLVQKQILHMIRPVAKSCINSSTRWGSTPSVVNKVKWMNQSIIDQYENKTVLLDLNLRSRLYEANKPIHIATLGTSKAFSSVIPLTSTSSLKKLFE